MRRYILVFCLFLSAGFMLGAGPAGWWIGGASGGSGNVTGPGSSTDNAIARYNGAGGASLQDSSVLIEDDWDVTGAKDITATGAVTGSTINATGAVDENRGLDLDQVDGTPTAAAADHVKVINHRVGTSAVLKRQITTATATIPAVPDISVTGPASVAILNADVEQTTANQINVVAHGLVTGDGPYKITSTGTTNLAMTGWTFGSEVWAIRIDNDEFSLSLSPGGAALVITNSGNGDHTMTKLTQSTDNAICTWDGTDGTTFHTHANAPTISDNGSLTNNTSLNSTSFSTASTHPAPATATLSRGYNMSPVTVAAGTPIITVADTLRLINRDNYPAIVGTIGAGTAATTTVRILHSHLDATRMVSPTTVVVSTPSQDTGTEICALDALTCVFVEETVPPVDGVAAAWTWQACGDDLTDTNWARAYCSTVTN